MRLGQSDLTAFVRNVYDRELRGMQNQRIKWGRALAPTVSDASVTIAGQYDINGTTLRLNIGSITPWVDELVVYRTGTVDPIWAGPITGWSEAGGLLTINAFDQLARSLYLDLPQSDETGDPALIISRVLAAQLAKVPQFVVDTMPSHKTATYKITNGRVTFTLDGLKTLLPLVDVTALADRIVVRGVDDKPAPLVLLEDDFAAEVVTAVDGTQPPDQVVCYGKGDLVGVYPPTHLVFPKGPTAVKKALDRPAATTVEECVEAAKNRYFQLQTEGGLTVTVPNNASLQPRARVSIDDLIPGRLFRVALNDRVMPVPSTLMKLTAVSGQQGNASDNRPRQPNGGFDKTAEMGKEYVGVTLVPYSTYPEEAA